MHAPDSAVVRCSTRLVATRDDRTMVLMRLALGLTLLPHAVGQVLG